MRMVKANGKTYLVDDTGNAVEAQEDTGAGGSSAGWLNTPSSATASAGPQKNTMPGATNSTDYASGKMSNTDSQTNANNASAGSSEAGYGQAVSGMVSNAFGEVKDIFGMVNDFRDERRRGENQNHLHDNDFINNLAKGSDIAATKRGQNLQALNTLNIGSNNAIAQARTRSFRDMLFQPNG